MLEFKKTAESIIKMLSQIILLESVEISQF